MKSLLILLTLYVALISATCADATNDVQSDQGPPPTAAHVLVNLLTDIFKSVKNHVKEDEEFEQDFLQPYLLRFISQMIPVVEKKFVDQIEDKLPRMIFKTSFSLLSLIVELAEKILDQFKDSDSKVRRPSHPLKQTEFLNDFNAAIIEALSTHTEQK